MDQQTSHEVSANAIAALGQETLEHACHICLAGRTVSNNWSLIEPLKKQAQVTVVEPIDLLLRNAVLSTVSVLVLDCTDGGAVGIEALRALKRTYPRLCVVLVNGGLTQNEIAAAFREGARDYFSHHYNTQLLVERVQYLCRQVRRVHDGGP
jgi:DNA-binding NarL/FixJ family response regulator